MAVHHSKKKKALELVAKGEDAVAYMKQENFSDEEMNEVLASAKNNSAPGTNETKAKAAPAYEEWRMERKGDKMEKLKLVRKNVKITEAEAETLNAGASSPGAINPIMYFLPGEGE